MQNVNLLGELLFKTGKYATLAKAKEAAGRQIAARQENAKVEDGAVIAKRFEGGYPLGTK